MTSFVLGGGCFWCLDSTYMQFKGVQDVEVGYMGGAKSNPTYEQVCDGNTGHVEVAKVIFDEDVVSAEIILDMFFTVHDPTQLNRQGNDIGSQYRSAIFTTSESQQLQAEVTRDVYQAALTREGIGEIVTGIKSADGMPYYLAEEYHQKYLQKNPNGYDCHSSTGVPFPALAK